MKRKTKRPRWGAKIAIQLDQLKILIESLTKLIKSIKRLVVELAPIGLLPWTNDLLSFLQI
jgi:hypothetical protein